MKYLTGTISAFCMLIALAGLFSTCEIPAKEKADALLDKANKHFFAQEYDSALAAIDTLRKIYPTAVETRRQALSLQQSIALRQTQEELAVTDSLLQAAVNDYNRQKVEVEKARAAFKSTPEMQKALTLTALRRDSLQTRFDLLCSKIRYIRKKQKE